MSVNPEDPVNVNTRASYMVDEAVGWMLGWGRGSLLRIYIPLSGHGVPLDYAGELLAAGESVDEVLDERRAMAQQALVDAADTNAKDEVLEARERAVADIDALIANASEYRERITEEINRDESRLVLDKWRTQQTGIPHYTRASLRAWAELWDSSKKLPNDSKASEPSTLDEPSIAGGSGAHSVDAAPVDIEAGSRRDRDSTLVTLALLVELLAERNECFRTGDKPSENAIAEELTTAAKKAAKPYEPLGQKLSTIRGRLAAARKMKEEWERAC